jgi:hypothetical protein
VTTSSATGKAQGQGSGARGGDQKRGSPKSVVGSMIDPQQTPKRTRPSLSTNSRQNDAIVSDEARIGSARNK